MAHAEKEVVINRPTKDVYNFLADGTNNPKWRNGVMSIELSSGKSGDVGSRYKQMLKGPGGRSISGDYKITIAKPYNEIGFVVTSGPARPTGKYSLESINSSTKLNFVLDFQPSGLARLMGPMIQKTMVSEVAQIENLKKLLEQ